MNKYFPNTYDINKEYKCNIKKQDILKSILLTSICYSILSKN